MAWARRDGPVPLEIAWALSNPMILSPFAASFRGGRGLHANKFHPMRARGIDNHDDPVQGEEVVETGVSRRLRQGT